MVAKQPDRPTEILVAFQGVIDPIPLSPLYRLGLGLVALAMVALPLTYLALVGFCGYCVYYHAVHNLYILGEGGSGPLFAYIAPLIIGGVLVLFMIKPLFARPPKVQEPRLVTKKEQPVLFAFVERVCQAVGAPRPRQIRVDMQVNASASFRRGALSMFGQDLTLTVGLPLVEGFTLRQLAGVLAHEFGHFAQGAGMRVTYVIRRVNHWFSRVVYERDSWDEALVTWSREVDIRIGIVFWGARLLVWLTRWILTALMYAGHVLSCFMLRQMEFDADRYEARLAGSACFAGTATRLIQLNLANHGAFSDLDAAWSEGRLAESLPGLIEANVEQIPAEIWEKVHRESLEADTGWFATHPADKDRVASARRENADGLFTIEGHAREVFQDYPALCRALSSEFYREALGSQFTPDRLVPVEEIVRRQREMEQEHDATARYFQGLLHPWRPLPLNPSWVCRPEDGAELKQVVIDARRRMENGEEAYREAVERFDELDGQRLAALQARGMIDAGFKLNSDIVKQVGLSRGTDTAAIKLRSGLHQSQEALESDLSGYEQAASRRLCSALSLYHLPETTAQIEDAAQRLVELPKLLSTACRIGSTSDDMEELRDLHSTLSLLIEQLPGNESHEPLIQQILGQMKRMYDLIQSLRGGLQDHPYPLEHADGEISLARYLFEEQELNEQDPGQLCGAAEVAFHRLWPLYSRCLGRLTLFAEDVEQVLGLPRQSKPEPEADTAEGPAG